MIRDFTKIFFVIFVNSNVLSQELPFKKNYVTFDIVSALPITRYTFGYERQLNRHLILGAGFGFNETDRDGRDEQNTHFYFREYKFETKLILTPSSKGKHFLSLEYQYIYHKEILYHGKFTGKINLINNYDTWFYEKGNYKHMQSTFNLGYGVLIPFGAKERWGIIPKFSVGYKFRNTKLTNAIGVVKMKEASQEIQDEFKTGAYDFGLYRPVYEQSTRKLPNLDLSVKIYYHF